VIPNVLHSKLTKPHIAKMTERERLYPMMAEILTKRLTTVIAGAGFGKTTLIAQAAERLNTKTLWYRLDSSDKDFTTFIGYLIAGLQDYDARFGEKTCQRIAQAQVIHREREAILRAFLNELESMITKTLLIILDDYHSIAESTEVRETISFLLENIPASIHLILISRIDPGLPLSRLRSTRDVLDIRERDLTFTPAEIEELYGRLFTIKLKAASLKILHSRTGGWAAGLILVYHYSRGKSPEDIEGFLANLKGSHRFIANYLEENVYHLQPSAIKDFLCKTSILSRLNAVFCNRLLGITDAQEILRNLEKDHLFTFPFDEERQWYSYHHLFQEFLQTRLIELGQEVIVNLHRKAAKLWDERGQEEEAIKHYLAAGEIIPACRLLATMGRRKLLKEGRLQLISSFIREIPEAHLSREPWIQYIQARVFELSGKPSEAIRTYEKAHRNFVDCGIAKYADVCLKGLGYNYFMIGDFQRAETILKELLTSVLDNARLRFDVLGLLIFTSSHLGKMSDADRYFTEAMAIFPGLNDGSLMAWLHFNMGFRYGCSGNYAQAIAMGENIKSAFSQQNNTLYLALAYHLISWSLYYQAHFSKGLDSAREGLRLLDKIGINDASRGWLLMDEALNNMGLGRYPEAISAGEEALQTFRELECLWGQSYVSHILQQLRAKTGDYSSAESIAMNGLEAIRHLELPMDKAMLRGSLAQMFLETGRLAEARPLLKSALRDLAPSKLHWCRAHLWYARYHWDTGNKKDALNHLQTALTLSESNDYDHWVAVEAHWIIPLLVEKYSKGMMQVYIRKIFLKMGFTVREKLLHVQKYNDQMIKTSATEILELLQKQPPCGLHVHCLGRFTVVKGDQEIPEERWKSKKAKMLFKILIHERDRGFVPKDALMENLWPGEDPNIVINRLHVALSSLRRTLEPELHKGEPSSYLIRNGDAYRLEVGVDGSVDVSVFRNVIRKAEKETDPQICLMYFLEAEKIYRGDFLKEDPYIQWSLDIREQLRQEYINVLRKIIVRYEAKADYEACIQYTRKHLSVDPYEEGLYQDLMQYYYRIGNKGMIVRIYKHCKEILRKDLDAHAGKDTEDLYQKLMSA